MFTGGTRIVDEIIADLQDRSGFGSVWDKIDASTREVEQLHKQVDALGVQLAEMRKALDEARIV